MGSSNVEFYLADSLYYQIPGAFAGNKELLMLQQNRIVSGIEIQLDNPFIAPADSSSQIGFNIKGINKKKIVIAF